MGDFVVLFINTVARQRGVLHTDLLHHILFVAVSSKLSSI